MSVKILLIDDDPDINETSASLLKKKGYTVLSALSGEEALELLKEQQPDIVVTDYRLPGINGDVLTHEMKSNLATAHIPVLMCTAQATLTQPLGGNPRLRRPDDYLVKPFNAADLLDKISLLTGR